VTESVVLPPILRGYAVKSHFSPVSFSADANTRTNLPAASNDSGHAIRFSSQFPWILAIVLSVAIWVVLGVSILQLI
jgi:hypothetical protein